MSSTAQQAQWSLAVAVPLAAVLLLAPGRWLLFEGPAGLVVLLAHGVFAFSAWTLLQWALQEREWSGRAMLPIGLWMAAGLVARRIYQPEHAYGATLALPYLAAVVGIALVWRAPRAALPAATVALLAPLAALMWNAHTGAVRIAVLTAVGVAAALLVQALAAPRAKPWRVRRLATAPALLLVAAQLWDGIVTYLSVVDPLGWAPGPLVEQVFLSAWILENTGSGFIVVKGLLGVVLALVTAPRGGWSRADGQTWGLHALMVFISLVPAAFSTSSLLMQ